MKVYIIAKKRVKAEDVDKELEKMKELTKDIPGAHIVVEAVKDNEEERERTTD